ncbi:hypothetical protein [Nitrospirillum viridazoti]|uniref:ABC-2 type transport system permease protein n=3 Tax=Nitrospirillum TaxID=1543705 RepID=A0A560IBF8_9PROT|nr:hypothetical protein [Nitrospirillum amazonense]TWB56387.1 ABC-2 type transport system permease protein [Nitrospirillum amazonense]
MTAGTLRPGTLAWLLRHELRLAARAIKLSSPSVWITLLAMVILFHVLGAFLALGASRGAADMQPAIGAMVAALACCFMMGTAIYRAMDTIYTRGDYDLLLSSPLSPAVILPARALAVTAGTLLFPASLILPIANMGAIFGRPNWLAAYLALPALALAVTGVALLVALLLVRWVGVRRARVVGQGIAAFTGMLMGLAGQIPRLLGPHVDWMARADGLRHGPLAAFVLLPGHALLGDPLSLAVLVIACVSIFAGVTARWGPTFIATASAAAGATTAATKAPTKAHQFQDRLGPLLRRKEWRLMRRHPQLPLLLFQQMSGAIILVISMQDQWRTDPLTLAALVVPLAALTAGTLAKLALADGAADLINAAPVPPKRLRQAKVEAAGLPPLAAVALVAALAGGVSLWGTLTILSCGIAATFCAVVASLWVQPVSGSEVDQVLKPRKGAGGKLVGRTLLEMMMSYGWMGATVLMLHHNPFALLVAGGLLGLVAILRAPL